MQSVQEKEEIDLLYTRIRAIVTEPYRNPNEVHALLCDKHFFSAHPHIYSPPHYFEFRVPLFEFHSFAHLHIFRILSVIHILFRISPLVFN